jgi:endonuclease-3
VPEDYDKVIKLPGIGNKMAYLYLKCCCNKIEGIAVDTHVHRISNRLGWVNNTKTPEETRKGLQKWLPHEYWYDANMYLCGFGQTICEAKKPKCEECGLKDICDFRLNTLMTKSYGRNKQMDMNELSKSKEKLVKRNIEEAKTGKRAKKN